MKDLIEITKHKRKELCRVKIQKNSGRQNDTKEYDDMLMHEAFIDGIMKTDGSN